MPALALVRRKRKAIVHYCQAIPGVSGTVARVGENGFGARWLFGNGGSGAVCDRPFVGMNKHTILPPLKILEPKLDLTVRLIRI
jgi:hypothetical protein